ncbi:GTP-binding protein [Synechococcus sp. M16CYN]
MLVGLTLALLVLVLVGLALQAIRTLLWDLSYLLPHWLLTPVLLLGSGLIAVVVIQVSWSWRQRYLRSTRIQPKKVQKTPTNCRDAANQSLINVDRLIERLKSEMIRKSLQAERNRVSEELQRGDLVIVVFGIGSSGKTSLIRALLQKIVGEVGAPMGLTTECHRYRFHLKGLERSLQLVDTPGILEDGDNGLSREEVARYRAIQADLIMVVVDSDLCASELRIVRSIADLGKRLLLVLNKRDLYGLEEEKRLLQILRSRCASFLSTPNVLACSAAPQSIARLGHRPLQPKPDITDLLQRLATILRVEGEELIADNILLQCRSLDSRGRDLLNQQRIREAQRCVDRYSWIGAGVVASTPLPLPGVDLLSAAAVNTQMVVEMANIYGIEMSKERARKLAISVGRILMTLGMVKGAMSLLSTALTLNLPTLLVGQAVQGITVAWLTRIAGTSFIRFFERDQDWGDGGMQDAVQEAFQLNRREISLKRFLETAMQQVVEPLQRSAKRRLPPHSKHRREVEASDHVHQEP